MDANKRKSGGKSDLSKKLQAIPGDIQEEVYNYDELMQENADAREYRTWKRIQESEKEED